MKNRLLIIIVILIISISFLGTMNSSYAAPTTVGSGTSATEGGLGDLSKYRGTTTGTEIFQSKVRNITSILGVIGSITSVVVLIAIGIKYMVGSIEEKAEYKKTLLPYVIGACIVFGISNFVGIIYNVAKNLF